MKRDSRFMILLYAGMVLVPLLLFAYLVAAIAYHSAETLMLGIAALWMIIFGIVGSVEIYAHGRNPEERLPMLKGNDIKKGLESERGRRPKGAEEVTVRIKRFNPQTKRFDNESYSVYEDRLATVLDTLLKIKSQHDNTLSMRYSCRMGICGSCGMVANGKPILACETNLLSQLDEDKSITVEPMHGHPVLKDLVTDFDDFFAKHESVEPHLYRKDKVEQYSTDKEYRQTKREVNQFLPYSYCIMCGLCMDACPVVNSNTEFVGPQALSQVYRYYKDSRDQNGKRRLLDSDNLHGAWGCEFSGSCSKACPKGVDPASAIQLLKASIIADFGEKE